MRALSQKLAVSRVEASGDQRGRRHRRSRVSKPTKRNSSHIQSVMNECAGRDVLARNKADREQKFGERGHTRALRRRIRCAALATALLAADPILAQEAPANPPATAQAAAKVPWAFSITVDGYIPPDQDDYVSPIVSADHGW